MEMLLLQLGGAVAKSVLSLWLGNVAIVGDVSGVAVDVLLERVPGLNIIERRRATRQFDRMAEAVAEKLAPFLEVEFGGLPENERAAAVLGVADAIERAGVTSDLLLSQDLDPLRLEAHVRAAAPGGREQLIPAAWVLYDHLLREACNYAVEIAVTLPPFASQAARESLRRETEIIDLIQMVLSKLPEPALAGRDGEDADARFETQYRRSLTRLLDRLELFGLDVSPLSKRYALSVAYITLSASDPEAGEDAEAAYVRVNEALAGNRRMLVRGEAGSGKTTLLQWLAVTSARQSFVDALGDWNGTVPFFVQLRRHAGGELPAPEHFLDDATPNLSGMMPTGWVHRQLNDGRALVLIDGVDELPEDERQRAREWLLDLTGTFEDARYVVTSRPTAPEDWLADGAFGHCMLQPMTLADVDSFIDHWHDAIRAALPDEADQAELSRLGTALKVTLRGRSPVRRLATSPLLCAMLCALHRERSEQLPQDRMELYRVALDMLLERRDVDRRIAGAERLPLKEKQLLLRDFAYWLVLNNYVDADQAAAVERVEHKLASMPRVNDDPPAVFRYLMERSGVLRMPVEGRVDFVHRTFQEYLAGEEAVGQDHVGLLVDNAHQDHWREVIILAAGHASLRQREALLRGLLDRGEREPEERHRLHLLAVACLETSPEVPAGLTAELQEVLSELLPPRSISEAKEVASAGELAVPLLAQFHAESARVAASCVRALTLIGGDDALNALAAYGRDGRVTVAEELIRAWESFDAAEFGRRVLANSPLR
jgi:energy-coupling factor transporter ATP-binding protein EcfA2